SMLVNGVRFFNGKIYVSSSAGISAAAPAVASADTSAPMSGGGCSIGRPGQPDPVLWVLVLAACLLLGRERFAAKRQTTELRSAQALIGELRQ
ncbi:MAG: JDVT-CTERM domain-containing protein, partial [Rhodoferax sp.]